MKRCTATTKAGSPCKNPCVPNEDQCFSHSPATREAHKAASSRGGKRRHGRTVGRAEGDGIKDLAAELVGAVKVDTVDDLLEIGAIAMADLLSLERSTARARALLYAIDKISNVQHRRQSVELMERLERLEKLIG